MNRQKEKEKSILNRQKDYQRKDKFMLGNGKFPLWYYVTELQIIYESNAYLRPDFWLNADFRISKSIFTPCNFSQCWKGRYYCFEVPYLNFFWCNFNYNFGSDLLLLVISLKCTCTAGYIDHVLTSTIQSFTFVSRHVLTFSTHCIGHLMRTAIC